MGRVSKFASHGTLNSSNFKFHFVNNSLKCQPWYIRRVDHKFSTYWSKNSANAVRFWACATAASTFSLRPCMFCIIKSTFRWRSGRTSWRLSSSELMFWNRNKKTDKKLMTFIFSNSTNIVIPCDPTVVAHRLRPIYGWEPTSKCFMKVLQTSGTPVGLQVTLKSSSLYLHIS